MFLSSEKFMQYAIHYVFEMAKASLCATDDVKFTPSDVYIVSHSFVLKNQKAMLSTTLPDGKYYEVTYNEATSEIYVDQYVKVQNKTIEVPNVAQIIFGKTTPYSPKVDDPPNIQPLYGCPIPPKPVEEGNLQYPIMFPNNNEESISLDDFVKHVKHEHPDYFPENTEFEAAERRWHDGIKRNITRRAITIDAERSFALLLDPDNRSLQDIMYFHINASEDAHPGKVCIYNAIHEDLLRLVVKTLYRMDWTANDTHQTLWTEQIAEILGISCEKVTDFIVH